MAVVQAPLFGLGASGSIGGSIVFSSWRGRPYVRRLSIPKNPKSGLQVGMRSVFKYITQAWAALTQNDKDNWITLAEATNITELNAMVAFNQKRARINQGPMRGPDLSPGTNPLAVEAAAAANLPKALTITWDAPSVSPGDYTGMVYMSKTTGFTPDIGTLVAMIDVETRDVTIPGLPTGVEQFIMIRETVIAGQLGIFATEISGTPT